MSEEKISSSGSWPMKNVALLLTSAFIWGTAFVAQSMGSEHLGAFTFNALRFLIGVMVLCPCIALFDRAARRSGEAVPSKLPLAGGFFCGLALFCGAAAQQLGIPLTTIGKTSFITSMYIVLVPILNLFRGKKAGLALWVGVASAVAGLYLLCLNETLSVNRGDALILLSALMYSGHILLVERYSAQSDCLRLSCIQFLVCGLLSAAVMLVLESPQWASVRAAWKSVLYTGIFSSGVAYTFQVIGQRGIDPTLSAIVLSLEAVFGVLAGWVILGQVLSAREAWGCVFMFCAIILAQLPQRHG